MTIYKMRNFLFLRNLCLLLFLFSLGCSENKEILNSTYEIPLTKHNVNYIPYNAKTDNPNYAICDSTIMTTGRIAVLYIGGSDKLRKDIKDKFLYNKKYEMYNGYIVIRFLVNCEGKTGRYRAQSLGLDFSPIKAPSGLVNYSIDLVKSLDTWTRTTGDEGKEEYSKYINLKIKNGQIQHILL